MSGKHIDRNNALIIAATILLLFSAMLNPMVTFVLAAILLMVAGVSWLLKSKN